MPFFRDTQGIGRGETAESRIELPFVAAFMAFCAVIVLVVHLYADNSAITLALAISMVVFGTTVVRVDLGVCILIMAMLLSPEIDFGREVSGRHELNIRYDDILIAVIFFGVLVKVAFEGRQNFWRPSPINAGILLYVAVCLASTVSALNMNLPAWDRRTAFFVMLKMAEFYMVYFMVGNAVRGLNDVRKFLVVFFAVAFFISAYCCMSIGRVDRIGTPFEAQGSEPNTLGGYLTIVMCVAMGLYTQAKGFWKKGTLFLIVASSFIPFLFTLSRASYFALLVGMLVLGFAARKWYVIAAVVLVVVLSPYLMPEDVKDRVNYTFQRGSGEEIIIDGKATGLQVDKSTHERVYVWQKVWYLLHVAPWFGGGIAWEMVLDSQYARVILETGLFGITAFLFMQFRLIRTCHEAAKWSRDWVGKGLAIGALSATIAMMTHSLGTISFLIVRIMEPFWFLMALTTVVRLVAIDDHMRRTLAARQKQQAESPGTPSPQERPTLIQPPIPAATPAALSTTVAQRAVTQPR